MRQTFTIPSDESVAGRIAVFLDPGDIEWLSSSCECDDATTDCARERCARVRFRCSTAMHKATQLVGCHFVAEIRSLTEQAGGRGTPMYSGHRPQVFIDGEDCDATLMIDGDTLNPGDVGVVYGVFVRPDRNCGKLSVGKALLIREGAKTVAYGVIVWRCER